MVDVKMRWWDLRREDLLALTEQAPIYVYNDETINEIFFDFLSMDALQGIYYPYGLNPHPQMLQKAFELGASFRCNSRDQISCLKRMFPRIALERLCLLAGSARDRADQHAVDSGVQVGMRISDTHNKFPGLFGSRDVFAFTDMVSGPQAASLSEKEVDGLYVGLESRFFSPGRRNEKLHLFEKLPHFFPNMAKLIVGNAVNFPGVVPAQKMDMLQLEDLLQVIQDALPKVQLFLEPPAAWVAHAGGLLVRVVDFNMPEAVDPTGIRLDVYPTCLASIRGSEDPWVVGGVNLSRSDEQDLVLRCFPSKDWQVEGGRVEAGDMLFLTHMGAHGPGEVRTATGRNGLPEYYLRARSMCPVKL